jgi:hypothetical protein
MHNPCIRCAPVGACSLQVDAHNGQTVVSSAVALHVRRHAAAAVRHMHHQQRLSQEAAAVAAAASAATAGATAGAVAAVAVDAPPLKITLATTVLPSGNEVSIQRSQLPVCCCSCISA